MQNMQEYGFWPESVEVQYVAWVGAVRGTHTAQMVAFKVINSCERTLTNVTAEMLVCRFHGGPPGRRGISGVKKRKERGWKGKGEVSVLH